MESAGEKPSTTTTATAALTAQKVVVQQQQATTSNQPAPQHHPSAPPVASLGTASLPQYHVSAPHQTMPGSKYQQLLHSIDELGRVIRPTYNANRNAQERLKRDIVHARMMVRECMAELEQQRKQHHQQQQT